MADEKLNLVAEKITFHQFSNFLQKLSILPNLERKKEHLKEFITEWRRFGGEQVKDRSIQDDSFFPAMRLILPYLDKDRDVYGIKEQALARLLIKVYSLGKNSPSATSLFNYKSNTAGISKKDFASVAHLALKDRCSEKGTLTLNEVNKGLDEIADGNVNNNREKMEKHLLHLTKHLSSRQLPWLIRIILKEVRVGVSMKSVFDCFHPDAQELYNVKLSLKKLCDMLRDRDVRMNEIGISLFEPFRPMLAERQDPYEVEGVFKDEGYIVETKWDGERVQLHYGGDHFKFFSRGGNEYTHVYGGNGNHGNLTPHIWGRCFEVGVESCILDGEMMGYDHANGMMGTKGDHFDIKSPTTHSTIPPPNTPQPSTSWLKSEARESDEDDDGDDDFGASVKREDGYVGERKESGGGGGDSGGGDSGGGDEDDLGGNAVNKIKVEVNSTNPSTTATTIQTTTSTTIKTPPTLPSTTTTPTYEPMYIVFDILYYNGAVLTNTALSERRSIMERVVRDIPLRMVLSKAVFKKTNQDCLDSLNEAISNREEGIMLKHPSSIYVPNKRVLSGWYKIKPDYLCDVMTELDVVVVGAMTYTGNTQTRFVNQFLCAVAKDPPNHTIDPTEFYTFCIVKNGFSNKELKELNAKLHHHWQPYDKNHPPSWFKEPTHSHKTKFNLVIDHPSNSVVFQVKAAEIISSDHYKAGYTLRFSRLQHIRYDKPWRDCLTYSQLITLQQETSGKLVTDLLRMGEGDRGRMVAKRKRGGGGGGRKRPMIDDRFVGISVKDVEKSDSCRIFEGKEICIMSDYQADEEDEDDEDDDKDGSNSSNDGDNNNNSGDNKNNKNNDSNINNNTNNNNTNITNNSNTNNNATNNNTSNINNNNITNNTNNSTTNNNTNNNNNGGTEDEWVARRVWSRAEMEEGVVRFHGAVVQNPGTSTYCTVAGKIILRVKSLAKSRVQILNADWLIRCLRKKQLLPWKPADVISYNAECEEEMMRAYDVYGDSYTHDVSEKGLRKIFKRMEGGVVEDELIQMAKRELSTIAPLCSVPDYEPDKMC